MARRKKNRKGCGWKCETEGEGGSEERRERETGRKILALYLPLIKSIALSLRETERGIDRDMMGGGGAAEQEIINRLMKLLL